MGGGSLTIKLAGKSSSYGVCQTTLCDGHFIASVEADSDVNYGLALVAEKNGKPDYDNYVCISVCKENNIPLVRVTDRQKGKDNVLDNTGKISGYSEQEFRYTVPLNNSYFSVPFSSANGKAMIIRNDISGFFHLYIGVGKTIGGEYHEDWIETAQVKDWNISGTRFFICPVVRLNNDKSAEIEFNNITFREFPSSDVATGEFKAETRPFTWAGFPGEALVVSFDSRFCPSEGSPRQFVFWTESNYVPAWHMNNELLYSYEFCETWSYFGKGCYEPMSDRILAYSDVSLLEDNAVRKVVKYHYALVNPDYEAPYEDGSFPEVDEYYTFYPDGTGIREIHYIQNGTPNGNYHELSEPMAISGSSTVPSDHCMSPAFVISNLSGAKYELYPDKGSFDAVKANVPGWGEQIYRARLKNSPDAFCVYPDSRRYPGTSDLPASIDLDWHDTGYQMSHFPVDKQKYLEVRNGDYTKSGATWPSQVSHTSFIGIEAKHSTDWQSDYRTDEQGRKYRVYMMMFGIVARDDVNSLNASVRSWLSYGNVVDPVGVEVSQQPDYGKKEITLRCLPGADVKSFALNPASEIRNPVILLENWGGSLPESVTLSGQALSEGVDYLCAVEDGELLLWFNRSFSGKSVFEIR